MGQLADTLIVGIAPASAADELDRLYCHHMATFRWAAGMVAVDPRAFVTRSPVGGRPP